VGCTARSQHAHVSSSSSTALTIQPSRASDLLVRLLDSVNTINSYVHLHLLMSLGVSHSGWSPGFSGPLVQAPASILHRSRFIVTNPPDIHLCLSGFRSISSRLVALYIKIIMLLKCIVVLVCLVIVGIAYVVARLS